ncbi:MAG: DUF4421 family protein [Bacteroidales bacterium]|nr:DUF4421 family protein [Bacteroidales bacterium]
MKIVFTIITIFFSAVCMAQEGVVQFMNNKLHAMYNKAKYDTNYVERPAQRFNAQVFAENGQSQISWKTDNYKADFTTYDKISVGLKFSYLGIGGGYSFSPKYANENSKTNEAKKFSFHYYGRIIGGEISYLKSGRVGGEVVNANLSTEKISDTLSQKMASTDLYYVYNNKKFSYPAALTSGFFQRKPCGSLLFGFSALYSETENSLSTTLMKQKSLSLGVGYGYNFILKDKWLIHLSVIPMIASSNKSNFKFEGQTETIDKIDMGFIATSRLSAVYNFSRYYISINGVMTIHQFGNEESLSVDIMNFNAHFDFGIRF